MKFIKNIHDPALILCPFQTKMQILKELEQDPKFYHLTFLTLPEFQKKYTFTYDLNAIVFVMQKHHLKYEVAKLYLDNLYYLDDSLSNNMQMLRQIKQELDQEKLLKYDLSFQKQVQNKTIYIVGYDHISKIYYSYFQQLPNEVIFIKEEMSYSLNPIWCFETLEEEIEYIMQEIVQKRKQNIPFDHIKLCGIREEYLPIIKQLSDRFHLPIVLNEQNPLASTVYGQAFLEADDKEAFLKTTTSTLKDDLLILCNQESYDLTKNSHILEKMLQTTMISNEEKGITIVPFMNTTFTEEDYVYILGFHLNFFPKVYHDEDFLYDAIKPSFCETTFEKNSQEEKEVFAKLHTIKNLQISYCQKSKTEIFTPSLYIKDYNLTVEQKHLSSYSPHSHLQNKIQLKKAIDDFLTFGTYTSKIDFLLPSYPELKENSYQNQFQKINLETFYAKISKPLILSYTSLNDFYLCQFRYYANYILKLKPITKPFETYLGSLCHHILQTCLNDPSKIKQEIENYQAQNPICLSQKEQYFLEKLVNDFPTIIEIIQDQRNYTTFTEESYEKKITFSKKHQLDFKIMGYLDKILKNPQEDQVAVIDYKTGNTDFRLNELEYGFQMQLPYYVYLLKKLNPKIRIAGIYLQNLLSTNLRLKENETKEQHLKDALKLNGFTNDDIELLEQFDKTYLDSQWIRSLKRTKTGFYAYSKVLSDAQMDHIVDLVESKITEAISKIEASDFVINPKRLEGKNKSCEFCPYHDLCYHTEENIIDLKEIKDLSFLGGEEDA